MKKTIEQMAQLLEKKNIPIPDSTRKKDGTSNLDGKEKCHALVASTSNSSFFITDLRAYRHMVSTRDILSSTHSNDGLVVQMGDESELQPKGIGN